MTQAVHILHHDRCVPPWRKLPQYLPQPAHLPRDIDLRVVCRLLSQLAQHRSGFKIHRNSTATVAHRMLPGKIAGNRKQVRLQVSDGVRIFDPEHPNIDLLGQIRGVGLASKASREKSLQSPAMSCKQPLQERFLGVSHFRPRSVRRFVTTPIRGVSGPGKGHPRVDSTPNYSSLRGPTRSMLHRPRQVPGGVRDHVHRLSQYLGTPENFKNRLVIQCAFSVCRALLRLGTP